MATITKTEPVKQEHPEPITEPQPIHHRVRIGAALFILLCSIYLLTFSANLFSNDELMMFDVTGSMVDFGDMKYDLAVWYLPTVNFDTETQYPLRETEINPLQMIAAAPFYRIAESLPGIGLVHMTWLLNVLVCAAVGVLFYAYGLKLGYSTRTALIAALGLGLLTVMWVYSKFFFREPLAAFFLLLAAYALEHGRTHIQNRRWLLAGAAIFSAIIATSLMLLTKDALIVVLPSLALLVIPGRDSRPVEILQRGAAVGLILLMALLAFTTLAESLVSTIAVDGRTITGYSVDTTYTQTTFHTYLFSIGGSVWASSPILLLALPGAVLLWRRGRARYVLAALLMLLGVTAGYGLLRSWAWFGGLSWPQRFLVPLVPFLFLLTLPAWDWLVRRFRRGKLPTFAWVGINILVLYSLWWQLSGLIARMGTYSSALPPESNGFADWLPGVNTLRYLRPVVITQEVLSGGVPFDFIWVRTENLLWPLMFAGILIFSVWMLRASRRASRRLVLALPLLLVLAVGIGLRSVFIDTRYIGDKESLHDMVDLIEQRTVPGDVVVLSDTTYYEFFLNYGKVGAARLVTLPAHPGERGSFEQELQVTSNNPDVLLAPSSVPQLRALAAVRDRLFILMETSSFLPWAIRPVERFMTFRYYPLDEFQADPPDPTVRLLEYDTTQAPDSLGGLLPQERTELTYGDSLELTGYALPEGTTYTPGSTLPLSLYWYAEEQPPADYTVAVFLASANMANIVQGMDSMPLGGFYPTSTWTPETRTWDNHAIRLPETLPAGEYQLWVRLYTRTPQGEVNTLSVDGDQTIDGDIGVLPVTINVG